MRKTEGFLDYGSGRYKLVGLPGMSDCYLHNGDGLEVFLGGRWLWVWAFSDGQRWWFQDEHGRVIPKNVLGLPARR